MHAEASSVYNSKRNIKNLSYGIYRWYPDRVLELMVDTFPVCSKTEKVSPYLVSDVVREINDSFSTHIPEYDDEAAHITIIMDSAHKTFANIFSSVFPLYLAITHYPICFIESDRAARSLFDFKSENIDLTKMSDYDKIRSLYLTFKKQKYKKPRK